MAKQSNGTLGITLGSGVDTQKLYVPVLRSESVLTYITPQHCASGDGSPAANLFGNKHKEKLGVPRCFA